MKEKIDWPKDFQDFMSCDEVLPPRQAGEELRRRVRQDLCPSPFVVFVKVAVCASLAGMLSLAVCPQFGMGGHSDIHHFFMSLGPVGCSLACGCLFMLAGVVITALVLRPEELRLVRSNKVLLISALSGLSLSAFVCLGATVLLESALIWFVGSWIGGFLGIEAMYALVFRRRVRRLSVNEQ